MLSSNLRTAFLALGAAALTAATLTAPLSSASASTAPAYPERLNLPDGFQPEGIDIAGDKAYLGSLADGSIIKLNLRNGNTTTVAPSTEAPAVGLKVDNRKRAFVAGGPTGTARVVDLTSGETAATYTFSTGNSFVNDVVFLKGDAYFTDSANAVLYKLDLGKGRSLPAGFETIPLIGEWQQVEGFNANGISTSANRKALVVINSTTGILYRVDPQSGQALAVDFGGDTLMTGDGLLNRGRTLYAVQNRMNQVAVVKLSKGANSGNLRGVITSEEFDVPTTVARLGNKLFLPNARFGTASPETAEYWVTKVNRKDIG